MGNTTTANPTNLTLMGFKKNDSRVLHTIYVSAFPKVRSHILKNSGNEADAKDIFQEAFVVCWKNIKEEKFDGSGNLEGYLFTIAKNKWTDYLRSAKFKKTVKGSDMSILANKEANEQESDTKEQEMMVIKSALAKLGSPCKNLLKQFYFERKSMDEIATGLGIGSASARNKKYRCMEKLRTLTIQAQKK